MVEIDCEPELPNAADALIRRWLDRFAASLDPDGRGRVSLRVSSLPEQRGTRVQIECKGASPRVAADVSASEPCDALARAFETITNGLRSSASLLLP
jgi:hypothetical protein